MPAAFCIAVLRVRGTLTADRPVGSLGGLFPKGRDLRGKDRRNLGASGFVSKVDARLGEAVLGPVRPRLPLPLCPSKSARRTLRKELSSCRGGPLIGRNPTQQGLPARNPAGIQLWERFLWNDRRTAKPPSDQFIGVRGKSTSGWGVDAVSTNYTAFHAKTSRSSSYAAYIEGRPPRAPACTSKARPFSPVPRAGTWSTSA